MKVLFIVNKLLYTCGVSSHVYSILSGLKNDKNIELYLICGGGVAIDKFKLLGVPIIINEYFDHEKRSTSNYFKAAYALSKFVSENKIDIVHSHHHYAASIAQKVKHLKLNRIVTILTNHGILPEVGLLNHFAADYIIAVNQHVVDYLIENGKKRKDEISLIRYGLPEPKIQNKNSKSEIKVLAASRFVPEKGLEDYIKAVSLIPEKIKINTKFYIAGEGLMEEKLQTLTKQLNCGITFLGRIQNLFQKMSDFDIFVNPTRSEAEGFPMSLIEAGFNRNLIITSDFWGLKPIFEANRDGLVYKKNDIEELKSNMIKAITNYSGYDKYVDNFYKKTLELFGQKRMVMETQKLYERIISS